MKVRRKKKAGTPVLYTVLGIMLIGMFLLATELWRLQGPQKSGFDEVLYSQSVRRVRLPAVRGKIYDRNGVCLADSVPEYCIAIYTEELRAPRSAVANVLELVHEIWTRVGVPPDISYRDIQEHFMMHPDLPLVAWKELDDPIYGRWSKKFEEWTAPPPDSTRRQRIPGLDLRRPVEGRSIVIHTDELRRRGTSTAANTLELVYEIAQRLDRPREVTFQDIKNHIYAHRPLPLLAWKNIDRATMASWADLCSDLSASDIYYRSVRYYPENENLAHLLGFTLEADAVDTEAGERIHFDLRGNIGVKGLEGAYNNLLEGAAGNQLVQVDVSGFWHRDLQSQPAMPGGDLWLTIDSNIQRFAREALELRQDGEDVETPVCGAVVVLDANNSDVLAMVSAPSFDPNAYMQSKGSRQALLNDPTSRTYHRAVFGQYPPGSTFKPVVALGVLKVNPDYGDVIHDCHGSLEVKGKKMNCWVHRTGGHGELNLREALMHSCNVYMYEMAEAVGYEPIREMALQFGLGQYVGLFPDLLEEPVSKEMKYGNLPDSAYNAIDLANMSIGQGAITASPLQMAMVAATIANGGTLYRPRLVSKWRMTPEQVFQTNPTWAIRRINLQIEAFELVRGGMHDVVMDPNGSGKTARVPGVVVAGKTGSAQFTKGRTASNDIIYGTHTWMISYAPFDFPRYAIAFLVEDGVSGGRTVGPRLSALYQKIFEYDGTIAKKGEK